MRRSPAARATRETTRVSVLQASRDQYCHGDKVTHVRWNRATTSSTPHTQRDCLARSRRVSRGGLEKVNDAIWPVPPRLRLIPGTRVELGPCEERDACHASQRNIASPAFDRPASRLLWSPQGQDIASVHSPLEVTQQAAGILGLRFACRFCLDGTGWKHHSHDAMRVVIHDLHVPMTPVRSVIRQCRNFHHTISQQHRSLVCGGKIAYIPSDTVWKELIRRRQMTIKARHTRLPKVLHDSLQLFGRRCGKPRLNLDVYKLRKS